MKPAHKNIISIVATLSLAAACGQNDGRSTKHSPTGGRISQEVAATDGSNIDGHYQAKFVTINPHVNGTIPGSVNFLRKGEKLYAYVRLFAGGVNAWHMQSVYTGKRCPTLKDDKNGDGFIDIQEAEAVSGKILIPLDSDLNTQNSGGRYYPLADLSGYYAYERIANFRRFLSDLQEDDENPDDDIVKLGPGQGLTFVGKVAMVFGVAATVELPDTVATKEPRRSIQTLPVACGVFEKVTAVPGVSANDADIGPTGSVIDGEDRPAPGDSPLPTTGGSGGGTSGTSGTNDSDNGHGPTSDGTGHNSGGASEGTAGGTGPSTTGESSSGTTTSGENTNGLYKVGTIRCRRDEENFCRPE